MEALFSTSESKNITIESTHAVLDPPKRKLLTLPVSSYIEPASHTFTSIAISLTTSSTTTGSLNKHHHASSQQRQQTEDNGALHV
jgi:hypothetical protein